MQLDSVIATLETPVPQYGVTREQVPSAAVEQVKSAAALAAEDKLTRVLNLVPQTPWLPDSASAALRLRAATGMQRFYPETKDPLPWAELRAVAEQATQDPVADGAVADWFDAFADEGQAEDAWTLIEPLARQRSRHR